MVAIVRGTTEGIGIQNIARDLGQEIDVNINTGASAALAVIKRWGAGRMRNVNVADL